MKLYEINKELNDLLAKSTDEDGVFDDSATEAIEGLEMAESEKALSTGKFILGLKVEIAALKDAEKRMSIRRKSAEKKMNNLTDYLSLHIDGKKFEDAECTISYSKSTSTYVDPAFVDGLPIEYKATKTVVTPDKKLIKKALDAGISLDGCELIVKQNIQIK